MQFVAHDRIIFYIILLQQVAWEGVLVTVLSELKELGGCGYPYYYYYYCVCCLKILSVKTEEAPQTFLQVLLVPAGLSIPTGKHACSLPHTHTPILQFPSPLLSSTFSSHA